MNHIQSHPNSRKRHKPILCPPLFLRHTTFLRNLIRIFSCNENNAYLKAFSIKMFLLVTMGQGTDSSHDPAWI